MLYRSDALSGLTAEGLEQLAATEIGVIVDFRTPMERRWRPTGCRRPRPFRIVELALLEGALTGLAQQAMQAGAQAGDPDAAAAAVQQALAQLPSLGALYVSMLDARRRPPSPSSRASSPSRPAEAPDAACGARALHGGQGPDRGGDRTAPRCGRRRSRCRHRAITRPPRSNLAGPWAERMFADDLVDGRAAVRPTLDALVAATPPVGDRGGPGWVDREHGGSAAYLPAGGLTDVELHALRARLTG